MKITLWKKLFGIKLFTLWIFLIFTSVILAQEPENYPSLFASSPVASDTLSVEEDPTVIRSRDIQIIFDLLPQNADALPGVALTLNLFDDVSFRAVFNQPTIKKRTGNLSLVGYLEGEEFSNATFIYRNGLFIGDVFSLNGVYQIRGNKRGGQVVKQIDTSKFTDDEPIIPPIVPVNNEVSSDPVASPDNGSRVDVMVIYTDDARVKEGGVAAINAVIDLHETNANTSFSNSDVNFVLRVVHTEEMEYNESNVEVGGNENCDTATLDFSLLLNELKNITDGVLDLVHSLRNKHGADIVSFLVGGQGNNCFAGRGFLMTEVSSTFNTSAFNAARSSSTSAFIHEIGHNMGGRHDRANDKVDGLPFNFNHGYVDDVNKFRTIMGTSEECSGCNSINFWSNPNVLSGASYGNVPTGIADGDPLAADNHRTLNETVSTVANFRQEVPFAGTLAVSTINDFNSSGTEGGPFDPAEITYTLSNTGETALIYTATPSASNNWVTVTDNGSGTIFADGSTTVTVSINSNANTLAVGSHFSEVTFINTTGLTGETRSVNLTVNEDQSVAGVLSSNFSDWESSGDEGGPFSPLFKSYTLNNTGGSSLEYTATSTQDWLTVTDNGTGTLAKGASTTLTVGINNKANNLLAENSPYTATVNVSNSDLPVNMPTLDVTLNVSVPNNGILSLAPKDNLDVSGEDGGPFDPASKIYTLTNIGETLLNYTATDNRDWITVTDNGTGTLAPGASATVTVSINENANNQNAGSHSGTVTFTNTSNNDGNTTRSVNLTVNALPGVLSVSPSNNLDSSGLEGGTFSPAIEAYFLTNTGGTPINYTVEDDQNWVSVTGSTSGTLAPGAIAVANVSVNSNANFLATGSHSGVITFTNTTNNDGNTTRTVNLAVNASPGVLSSSFSGLESFGNEGGPFNPPSGTYTLINIGGSSLDFTATATQDWLTVTNNGTGTLAAGDSTTLTVSINSNANSLLAANSPFTDTVTVTNSDLPGNMPTLDVTLTILALNEGTLSITPTEDFDTSGNEGGPFSPSTKIYTLTNSGTASLNYSALATQNWVTVVDQGTGGLAPRATANVRVDINENANGLLGINSPYSDTVSFTNTTNGNGNTTRSVNLTAIDVESQALQVTPLIDTFGVGNSEGSFSQSFIAYNLSASGADVEYSVSNTKDFISLSKTSGTILDGTTETVLATFNANANTQVPGSHRDVITFTNTTNPDSTPIPRTLSLYVRDPAANPPAGVSNVGLFQPTCIEASCNDVTHTYTLTNMDPINSLEFTGASSAEWLDLSLVSPDLLIQADGSMGMADLPKASGDSSVAGTVPAGSTLQVYATVNSNVAKETSADASVVFLDSSTSSVLGSDKVTLTVADPPLAGGSTGSVISPFWQAGSGTFTFIAVSHPSLAEMNSEIGVTVYAIQGDGNLFAPSRDFSISSNVTQKIFILATGSGLVSEALQPTAVFLQGPSSGGQGFLSFQPVASDPNLTISGGGYADVTMLSFWGAVVVQSTSTGFAMEFIGDANDSRVLNQPLVSGMN